MNIIDHPSPNHSDRSGPPRAVVMHTTIGTNSLGHLCDPDPIDPQTGRPNRKLAVSAHYLIRQDGVIIRLVPEERQAWHGGTGKVADLVGSINDVSIGIELESLDRSPADLPDVQVQAAIALVREIVQRYAIPRQYVVRHADCARPKGRKIDPAHLNWDAFLAAVFAVEPLPLPTTVAYVCEAGSLRVRREPNTTSPILACLRYGERVEILEETDGERVVDTTRWGRCNRGWVTLRYLRPV